MEPCDNCGIADANCKVYVLHYSGKAVEHFGHENDSDCVLALEKELKAERGRIRNYDNMVEIYAQHKKTCPRAHFSHHECNCGLVELIKLCRQPTEEAQDWRAGESGRE